MGNFQLKLQFPTERRDSFGNFVAGRENQETLRVCSLFCRGELGGLFSLVIHGPRFCGKTHLLSAMGRDAAQKYGSTAAVYLDCASLTAGNCETDDYGRLREYVRAMESARFLAVDHLEAIQESGELSDLVFHLYNEVTGREGGRFAGAVSVSPPEWKFPDWLKTRLLWGSVMALKPVEDEARPEVLIKMAADMRMTLPPEAAHWLVTHLPRDQESLHRALAMVDRHSLTTGRKVSIPLIKTVLEQTHGR